MRSRSLLVVLSLLAVVFAAGPVEAASRTRNTRAKKIAAQKRAAAARRKAGETSDLPGAKSIASTRRPAAETETPAPRPVAKKTATPTTTRTRVDSTAAVAPRRRFVKVKRFFAGLAIVGALSAGAVGWQAADMNGKVGNAYTYVSETIAHILWGGSHDDPGTPDKPTPPFPDPGPPLPVPDPQPDPSPSPSGGHGHQTPKGPETDRTPG